MDSTSSLPYNGLPNELLEEILKFMPRNDLARVCRVSKHLRVLAEPYLYRRIKIAVQEFEPAKQTVGQLSRTLSERPQLAHITREFRFDDSEKLYEYKGVRNYNDIFTTTNLDTFRPQLGGSIRDKAPMLVETGAMEIYRGMRYGAILELAALVGRFPNLECLKLLHCSLTYDAIIDLARNVDLVQVLHFRRWKAHLRELHLSAQLPRRFPRFLDMCGPLEKLHIDFEGKIFLKHDIAALDTNGSIQSSRDTLRSLCLVGAGLMDAGEVVNLGTLNQFSRLERLSLSMRFLGPHYPYWSRKILLPSSLKRIDYRDIDLHDDILTNQYGLSWLDLICSTSEVGPQTATSLLGSGGKPVNLLPNLKDVKVIYEWEFCECSDEQGLSHCLGLQSLNNLKDALERHGVHCEMIRDDY